MKNEVIQQRMNRKVDKYCWCSVIAIYLAPSFTVANFLENQPPSASPLRAEKRGGG